MGRSLSQRLKRSSRYGTSNLTPKRPCLSTNLSPSATSSNCDLPCSSDRSLADLDKENESVAIENSPSMSHSSDQVPVIAVSDANSTPQNTTTDTSSNFRTPQSLEHLRQRRNELQRSIAAKEQTLRNLNLVKQHRTKNDIEMLKSLTTKWHSVVQKALVELYEFIPEPARPSLMEFINHLQLDPSMIGFSIDDEAFD